MKDYNQKNKLHFKYSYNKVLFLLSIILILALYITIRECQYPLLFDNTLFILLFTSKSSDATLYNISLSYIAAYVFYVIQVYIPQYINNKKGIYNIQKNLTTEIQLIDKLLCIYHSSIEINEDFIEINPSGPIYIIEKHLDYAYLSRFTYQKSYIKMKQQILDLHASICTNPSISLIDTNLIQCISNIPLDAVFNLLDNIYKQIDENRYWPISLNGSISQLHTYRNFLVSTYKFIPNTTYEPTTYQESIVKYQTVYKKHLHIHEYDFRIKMTE